MSILIANGSLGPVRSIRERVFLLPVYKASSPAIQLLARNDQLPHDLGRAYSVSVTPSATMFPNSLLFFLLSLLVSFSGAACPDESRRYWETDINHDCGQVENGAKFQQVGAMQWNYPDANGHLPYSYNTKVCLTESFGCDCIRLSSAEDHKVNRFYLATGFFITVYRYALRYEKNGGYADKDIATITVKTTG